MDQQVTSESGINVEFLATCLYNDAFSRSLGPEKHPAILGVPGRKSWEEVWPIVGAQIERVLRW